jgi:hypothetical protein
MSITAKAKLVSKAPVMGEERLSEPTQYQLAFAPDYAEGANAEWAKYTPSLSLSMVVVAEIADLFTLGPCDITITPAAGTGEFAVNPEHEAQAAAIADGVGGEPVSFDDAGHLEPPAAPQTPDNPPSAAGDAPPEAAPKSKR